MTKSRGIRNIPNGYWQDEDNGMAAMQGLVDLIGRYPTIKEANEYLPGLATAIRKKDSRYGSWFEFKEKMGYGDALPTNYWKDTDNGVAAMSGLIDLLDGNYPTREEAEKYLPTLVSTIRKKGGPYGGWGEFRRTMGYEDKILTRGYWNSLENIMGAMQGMIDVFGRYPTNNEVKKNLPSLAYAIERRGSPSGGWNKFKETMGYGSREREPLPRNYWNDTDNGMAAMASLIDIFGRYPKFDEANEYVPGLVTAIKKRNGPYGGWFKFKDEMGYLERNPAERLIAEMKTDEMRMLVSKLGLNKGAMWDILAVKYGVDRSKVIELFKSEPSLEPYMGDFVTGINNMDDWDYVADRTLPYDDETGTVKKILEMSLFDSVMSKLGAKPSMESVNGEIKSLDSTKLRKENTPRLRG